LVDELPQGKHWIHEVKHDGYLLAGAIILQRREHVEDRIAILKGHLEGTGRQFIDMRADETKYSSVIWTSIGLKPRLLISVF
jgi:hypothetical protein